MYRNDGIKRGRWTSDERAEFERLLRIHGKEWKKISEILKTRTVVQVRTHAQKYFKKLAKTTGKPVVSTSKKQGLYVPNALPYDSKFSKDTKNRKRNKEVQNMHIHSSGLDIEPLHSHKLYSLRSDRLKGDQKIIGPPKEVRTVPISLINLPSDSSLMSKSTDSGKRRRSRRLSRKWSTVTPRTMAAATILAAPHLRKNSEDVDELEGNLDWAVATLSEQPNGNKRKKRRV